MTYPVVLGPRLLPPGGTSFSIGINQVPDSSHEPRLENDAGQRQQGQLGVVPGGHTAHEHVRVGGEPTEVELLTPGGPHLRHPVHREDGAILVPLHVHLVPVAVVEVPADGDDLRTAS